MTSATGSGPFSSLRCCPPRSQIQKRGKTVVWPVFWWPGSLGSDSACTSSAPAIEQPPPQGEENTPDHERWQPDRIQLPPSDQNACGPDLAPPAPRLCERDTMVMVQRLRRSLLAIQRTTARRSFSRPSTTTTISTPTPSGSPCWASTQPTHRQSFLLHASKGSARRSRLLPQKGQARA